MKRFVWLFQLSPFPAVSHVASIDFPAEYITVVLETTEVVGITPKIIEFTTCELPNATNS